MALAALTLPIDSSFAQIDFTQHCAKIAVGVKIYDLYFNSTAETNYNSTGNISAIADNAGPANYSGTSYSHGWKGWSNSTPPDWINFWRDVLPENHYASSDEKIIQLTNQTDFFAFFDYSYDAAATGVSEYQVNLTDLASFSDSLISSGGCTNYSSTLASDRWLAGNGSYTLTKMIEDCMLMSCCPLPLNSKRFNDTETMFPGTPWTYAGACSFYPSSLCNIAIDGNPDLGGIGVRFPDPSSLLSDAELQ